MVNAGTITGTAGTALHFGINADALILDPGAAFQGEVNGGTGAANTVELAAGAATGSIGGFGQTSGNGHREFCQRHRRQHRELEPDRGRTRSRR